MLSSEKAAYSQTGGGEGVDDSEVGSRAYLWTPPALRYALRLTAYCQHWTLPGESKRILSGKAAAK